jgi:hypothetical protein
VRDLVPQCNELIYDNYHALAFGWSPTDRVGHTCCNIAIGRTSGNIQFGFYWGSEIADPEKKLTGEGNQYRYLLAGAKKDFPGTYIRRMLKEVHANSLAKVKDQRQIMTGLTITKSISLKRGDPKVLYLSSVNISQDLADYSSSNKEINKMNTLNPFPSKMEGL